MMHLHMIGLAILVAVSGRILAQAAQVPQSHWQTRWNIALTAFVVPPLVLLATAVAVVSMGTGTAHLWEGQLSYGISLGFVVVAVGRWLHLAWLALKTQREVQRHPKAIIQPQGQTLAGAVAVPATGRVMNVPTLFSAQVGLWSSELVVSQGLLNQLDDEHLEAVLAHEAGHAHYRDTFWFFWLGGLRRLTSWLPCTEMLWQELLLLREVRADRWAAQRVDSLVLAESLMSVITAPLMATEAVCAGFSCAAPRSRLAQRVDALLEADSPEILSDNQLGRSGLWTAIVLSLTPLLTIPFHY